MKPNTNEIIDECENPRENVVRIVEHTEFECVERNIMFIDSCNSVSITDKFRVNERI